MDFQTFFPMDPWGRPAGNVPTDLYQKVNSDILATLAINSDTLEIIDHSELCWVIGLLTNLCVQSGSENIERLRNEFVSK